MLHTQDAGESWTSLTPCTSYAVFGISIDEVSGNGFSVGESGATCRSRDRGLTWSLQGEVSGVSLWALGQWTVGSARCWDAPHLAVGQIGEMKSFRCSPPSPPPYPTPPPSPAPPPRNPPLPQPPLLPSLPSPLPPFPRCPYPPPVRLLTPYAQLPLHPPTPSPPSTLPRPSLPPLTAALMPPMAPMPPPPVANPLPHQQLPPTASNLSDGASSPSSLLSNDSYHLRPPSTVHGPPPLPQYFRRTAPDLPPLPRGIELNRAPEGAASSGSVVDQAWFLPLMVTALLLAGIAGIGAGVWVARGCRRVGTHPHTRPVSHVHEQHGGCNNSLIDSRTQESDTKALLSGDLSIAFTPSGDTLRTSPGVLASSLRIATSSSQSLNHNTKPLYDGRKVFSGNPDGALAAHFGQMHNDAKEGATRVQHDLTMLSDVAPCPPGTLGEEMPIAMSSQELGVMCSPTTSTKSISAVPHHRFVLPPLQIQGNGRDYNLSEDLNQSSCGFTEGSSLTPPPYGMEIGASDPTHQVLNKVF